MPNANRSLIVPIQSFPTCALRTRLLCYYVWTAFEISYANRAGANSSISPWTKLVKMYMAASASCSSLNC